MDVYAMFGGTFIEFDTADAVPTVAIHVLCREEADGRRFIGCTQGGIRHITYLATGGYCEHLVVTLNGEGELRNCIVRITHIQEE